MTETTRPEDKNWARARAVSFHDVKADWFASQYSRPEQRFASAFLYGRHQINIHCYRQIALLPRQARILDVGCGTGEQLTHLLKLGFEAFGVEPSEKMRCYAVSKLPAGVVLNGSVLDLPFASNSFDFMYAIEVFRYLDYADNLCGLQEIHRVLKPGGVFFGTFVNLYALDGSFVIAGARKLMEKWFGKGLRFHTEFETPQGLKEKLLSAGFSDVETHGAMVAGMFFVYKLGQPFGEACARLLEPLDALLSDTFFLRPFAGHLIGIARK